ncbi:MAG: hypothetical protein HYR62_01845 [Actinobacteria bacterium]|nr:hypothetical protein [Actinomycetota bacterium]MBI3687225.1 hypothetical protein [Actinomycetota bacterium]
MPPLVTSVIRTWSPMLAGWLLSLPVAPLLLRIVGVEGDRAAEVIGGAVTVLLGWVWYLAVRTCEQRWPRLGVLLGVSAQPTYPGRQPTAPTG